MCMEEQVEEKDAHCFKISQLFRVAAELNEQ